MQKVAAYCRVSTDKGEQAQSLISQKRYFDEYIRRHADWNLVNVYFDEGTSGTQTRKREGFNRMIGDAMSGQIDLILTKEVSRFARNTVDALAYTRMLRERRIGVIFISGQYRYPGLRRGAAAYAHGKSRAGRKPQDLRADQMGTAAADGTGGSLRAGLTWLHGAGRTAFDQRGGGGRRPPHLSQIYGRRKKRQTDCRGTSGRRLSA